MTTPTDESKMMTLLVKPLERELLDLFCEQDGRSSRSAIVRKMIVQEAERRGININDVAMTLTSVEAGPAS
jgi:hypothetical protein